MQNRRTEDKEVISKEEKRRDLGRPGRKTLDFCKNKIA